MTLSLPDQLSDFAIWLHWNYRMKVITPGGYLWEDISTTPPQRFTTEQVVQTYLDLQDTSGERP